jgi:hypothetical protein
MDNRNLAELSVSAYDLQSKHWRQIHVQHTDLFYGDLGRLVVSASRQSAGSAKLYLAKD